MIVSWNWLKEYVSPTASMDEVVEKLTMSGLNHETTQPVFGDFAIDLEVTSNRSDCLGHIGVAREIAVLFDHELRIPDPQPATVATAAAEEISIRIDCPQLCPRYSARVIKGVKVGPSPAWLQERLEAAGLKSVNNIVDATNYVMLECGQPLHAFDLSQIKGREIVVREAFPKEEFLAIDHRTYQLQPGMCVIADAERAVALGGVMGGADSEVAVESADLLIEAAEFASQSIRQTARQLKLHSDASYRFERSLDSSGVDWASRRCCELILEIAGGELLEGVVDVGRAPLVRESIGLRFAQIRRVLGIEIPSMECQRILTALGCELQAVDHDQLSCVPPSWRSDLCREIDLIEELARVHGYDQIPENVAVPMTASHRSDRDRSLAAIRHCLTACGFDEAMTPSLIPESWEAGFSPWSSVASLKSLQPMEGVLDRGSQTAGPVCCLRRSLLASLVEARRINEFRGNETVELFEIAKVYLPQEASLPSEPLLLSLVSQGDFFEIKGVVETLLEQLHVKLPLGIQASAECFLDPTRQAKLMMGNRVLGWIGELSGDARQASSLRQRCTVAEINLEVVLDSVLLIPQQKPLSAFPAVDRDFNFVVDEAVRWADLAATVNAACGEVLEHVQFREVFRDQKKDGDNKKRILLSIRLRALDETLTGERADAICQQVIDRCRQEHEADLLA